MPFNVTQTPKAHRMAKCRYPAEKTLQKEKVENRSRGYDKIEVIVPEVPTSDKRKGKQP